MAKAGRILNDDVNSGGFWHALQSVWDQLVQDAVSMNTIGGMILALVIFNVYEHTDLGTKVKMGVGWRSALLIGVLAGLFSERLLQALNVFLGTTK